MFRNILCFLFPNINISSTLFFLVSIFRNLKFPSRIPQFAESNFYLYFIGNTGTMIFEYWYFMRLIINISYNMNNQSWRQLEQNISISYFRAFLYWNFPKKYIWNVCSYLNILLFSAMKYSNVISPFSLHFEVLKPRNGKRN